MEHNAVRPPGIVETLLEMAAAGIAAVDGEAAVRRAFAAGAPADLLARAERVLGVAVGKAAPRMHAGVRAAAGEKWAGGVVVSHLAGAPVTGADHYVGDHPIPGTASAAAGSAALAFLAAARLTARDLVVVSVSGGTSALLAVPVPGLDVADLAATGDALLRSGVGIGDVNAVRRLLSATHNGGVAAAAAPGRVLGLLMSDTPGARPAAIGSGPTFPPLDTRDAASALVAEHVPAPARDRVQAALEAAALPGVGEVHNEVVAGPAQALAACGAAATDRGLEFVALPDLVADSEAAAAALAAELGAQAETGGRVIVAAGGEIRVRVRGTGRGGRCQQLAWDMVPHLAALPGSAFAAVATDGRDHLPGVGGAWVTHQTASGLLAHGLSWEEVAAASDAHRGLSALGQLLAERATGTNVADLYLAGIAPQARSSR